MQRKIDHPETNLAGDKLSALVIATTIQLLTNNQTTRRIVEETQNLNAALRGNVWSVYC